MLAIQDNFFSQDDCNSIYEYCIDNYSSLKFNYLFQSSTLEDCLSSEGFKEKCVSFASRHFDLSQMVGFEYWHNFNLPPNSLTQGWHLDKDEKKYHYDSGELIYPLCTIVFYPIMEKEEGGELVFKEFEVETVMPRTNRILCFSPGVWHSTNYCKYKRISISICPWTYEVEKFIPEIHQRGYKL